jgi:ABC-type uncharacterized transport system ATPase subunit
MGAAAGRFRGCSGLEAAGVFDEPLAGLAAAERERFEFIKSVALNLAVLIAQHDIGRVLGFPVASQ